jgi:hypothetical protein
MVDKVVKRIAAWKGRLLNRSWGPTLVKSALFAILVHISMAIAKSPRVIKTIKTLIRGFLWRKMRLRGSGWLVPLSVAGLGIPNLHLMGFTLCLRWLWLACTETTRTWTTFRLPSSSLVNDFFKTSVSVVVGDGMRALFWSNHWINDTSIKTLAPNRWAVVLTRIQNKCMVVENLTQRKWIQDIKPALTL